MTRMARCSCGSLRAEVSADPIYVIACHCDECQRRAGSVVGVGAYYKREQVQINGPNKAFVRAGPEKRTVTNHFCPECGTPLFWQGDIAPGIAGIAVGGFVDPGFASPFSRSTNIRGSDSTISSSIFSKDPPIRCGRRPILSTERTMSAYGATSPSVEASRMAAFHPTSPRGGTTRQTLSIVPSRTDDLGRSAAT